MQLPTLSLYKKELQQNAILYLLPLPFAMALIYLKVLGAALPTWMGSILGLAVPFTLAVAYGLQAFDVEEDAQTRDFLLVKPLSLWRIVSEKFIIGVCFVTCWVAIAIWGALPNLQWPTIYNIDSWIPCLILFGSIMTYGASFFTGLWISGPKKLLFASITSILGLAWGFYSLSSLASFIIFSQLLSQLKLLQELLLYIAGFTISSLFIFLNIHLSIWFLQQRPDLAEYPRLGQVFGISLMIPIIVSVLNFSLQSPLRPTYFYGAQLLGVDTPFWPIDGAWQPNGSYIALINNHNQIGLSHLGEKPNIIYTLKNGKENSIKDLVWSPDGKKLSFVVHDQIYFMNIKDKKPIWLGKGFTPSWSRDSNTVLFARESGKPLIMKTSEGNRRIYSIDFFTASTNRFLVKTAFNIQSVSPYFEWDSKTDTLFSIDPYGRLVIFGKEKVQVLPLPAFPVKEGIFWGRFFSVPKDSEHIMLAVYTTAVPFLKNRTHQYNIRFYQIGVKKKKIDSIGTISNTDLANLIFDPKSGTILMSQGFSFREIKLGLERR